MKLVYLVWSAVLYVIATSVAEREIGEHIIGSIIPIHQAGKQAQSVCGLLSEKGVAIAEAMKLGVNTINSKYALLGGDASKLTLGYDLRDSCDNTERGKDIAYSFNAVHRAYKKTKQGEKPVSVVLGRFGTAEIPVMKLLAFERLPQVSYAAENVKLLPDHSKNSKDARLLLSTHPDDFFKLKAVVNTIKALKIEYVQLVTRNNIKGKDSVAVIKEQFDNNVSGCHSNVLFIESKQTAQYVVSQLKRNPLANVAVLNLDHEASLWIFEEAKQQNLTGISWFSTASWVDKKKDLEPYAEQIEGMVFIANKQQDAAGFQLHLSNLQRPYNDSATIRQLFLQLGGAQQCLEEAVNASASDDIQCDNVHSNMIAKLLQYKSDAAYTIDAVYAFAHALKKVTANQSLSLIDAMKAVRFTSPLTTNSIQFNSKGIVTDAVSVLYNIQNSLSNKQSLFQIIQSGSWNEAGNPKLSLNKQVLRWKHGSQLVPVSKCSSDCHQGYRRLTPKAGPKCCWTCEPCNADAVSSRNNSQLCEKCGPLEVANPQQTSCVKFKKTAFRWFEPLGEFMIFLITAGLCVTFFTLGIFSQNRECDVVRSADYKMMVFMLFGLMLCFFAPVPLLLEPSIASCISYVVMFNFGLTIPLAVLYTKSATVRHGFFDENMELKKSTLGSKPQLIILAAVLIGQAIVLGIGIRLTTIYIEYYPTNEWDVKYVECSYVRDSVFWVGFGYNVILSILLTFLSCNSVKMNDDFKELKRVCITTCCFYLMSILFVGAIYSVYGSKVVEAASVLIILFGFMFLLTYFAPKLRLVLFHQPKKPQLGPDGKPLMEEEPHTALAPLMSGNDAFKHQKVLAIKIRDK